MKSKRFGFGAAVIFAAAVLIGFASCKNTFDGLIPNNEQKILDMNVKDWEARRLAKKCEINNNGITLTVPEGTDVTRLIPEAVISKQATLFPVTLRYLQEAFPSADALRLAEYAANANDIGALDKWFMSLYAANPDFNVPPLVFPINFLSPVSFVVIGGQGGFEMYTVKVMYDDGTDPVNGLLPPGVEAEKNILSFSAGEVQVGAARISEDRVDFKVKAGTEVRSILPAVTVSDGAVLLPATNEYLKPFCEAHGLDFLDVLSGFITAGDKRAYIRALLAPLNIADIRVNIDKPIDFTLPVTLAVLGKDKDVKLYTAACSVEDGEAYLEAFAVTKFKNPGIETDGAVDINETSKAVSVELLYPVEYAAGRPEPFALYCDAVFTGDSAEIEYKGKTYALSDKIPFAPEGSSGEYDLGTDSALLHISAGGVKTAWNLILHFKEDPESVRSITDFRFQKFHNASLKADSMAAISNDGHVGYITGTVLYSSAEKPESLVPAFISGGNVSVNGAPQISGVDSQNFIYTVEYLCSSKNGLYSRRYTVKIDFIKAENTKPELKSFKFSKHLNKGITEDAVGMIDEGTESIYVNVKYSASVPPEFLIPEFQAAGLVTVNGVPQSSGYTKQSFKYTVYYKVTGADDPLESKTYAARITFIPAADSACGLSGFGFLKKHNGALEEDVSVYISEYSASLYAVLPKEADLSSLVPSFTAEGRVTVNGVPQTSGVSAVNFTHPVEYRVTSDNGLNSKTYTVRLQKAGGIIFVHPEAKGRENGVSWEDAYTSLEVALRAAAEVSGESPAEIWITGGAETKDLSFPLMRPVILRGGFKGFEKKAEERGKNARRTVLENVRFTAGDKDKKITGRFVFDCIEFTGYGEGASGGNITGADLWNEAESGNALEITNCTVNSGRFEGAGLAEFRTAESTFGQDSVCNIGCEGSVSIKNARLRGEFSADGEAGAAEILESLIDAGVNGVSLAGKNILVKDSKLSSALSLSSVSSGVIKLENLIKHGSYDSLTVKGAKDLTVEIAKSNLSLLKFTGGGTEVMGAVKIKASSVHTVTGYGGDSYGAKPLCGTFLLEAEGSFGNGEEKTGYSWKLPSLHVKMTGVKFFCGNKSLSRLDTSYKEDYANNFENREKSVEMLNYEGRFFACGGPAGGEGRLKIENCRFNYIDRIEMNGFSEALIKNLEAENVQLDVGKTGRATIKDCPKLDSVSITITSGKAEAENCTAKNFYIRGASEVTFKKNIVKRRLSVSCTGDVTVKDCDFTDTKESHERGVTVSLKGGGIRVNKNKFRYGSRLELYPGSAYDIGGNTFEGADEPPADIKAAYDASAYFSLTFAPAYACSLEGKAFPSLSLSSYEKDHPSPAVTVKNCMIGTSESGSLTIARKNSVIDACKFGKNSRIYGNAENTVIQNLNLDGEGREVTLFEGTSKGTTFKECRFKNFLKGVAKGFADLENCRFYYENLPPDAVLEKGILDITTGKMTGCTFEDGPKKASNFDILKIKISPEKEGCVLRSNKFYFKDVLRTEDGAICRLYLEQSSDNPCENFSVEDCEFANRVKFNRVKSIKNCTFDYPQITAPLINLNDFVSISNVEEISGCNVNTPPGFSWESLHDSYGFVGIYSLGKGKMENCNFDCPVKIGFLTQGEIETGFTVAGCSFKSKVLLPRYYAKSRAAEDLPKIEDCVFHAPAYLNLRVDYKKSVEAVRAVIVKNCDFKGNFNRNPILLVGKYSNSYGSSDDPSYHYESTSIYSCFLLLEYDPENLPEGLKAKGFKNDLTLKTKLSDLVDKYCAQDRSAIFLNLPRGSAITNNSYKIWGNVM